MRTTPLLAGIAVLVALAAARAPEAHTGAATAPADDLQLSADGVHWGQALDTTVFDGSARWVPGETRTTTFWVRGGSGTPATVLVTLARPRGEQTAVADDVRLKARVDHGSWSPGAEPARLTVVTDSPTTDQRGHRVEVRASVAPQSGTVAMGQPVGLDFEVTLLRDGDRVVALERSPVDWRLLLLAAAGAVGAVVIVVAGRRRRTDARHG